MECNEIIVTMFEAVTKTLEETLEGLDKNHLNWRPGLEGNSIGWLAWHLTRVQDGIIAASMEEEHIWVKEGWHAKFGRPADAGDIGYGHTRKEAAAFKSPGVKALLGYHRAVLERSKAYISKLSKADMDAVFKGPMFQPAPKVGTVLTMILTDNLQHLGQAAYLRGLRQGLGWKKA